MAQSATYYAHKNDRQDFGVASPGTCIVRVHFSACVPENGLNAQQLSKAQVESALNDCHR